MKEYRVLISAPKERFENFSDMAVEAVCSRKQFALLDISLADDYEAMDMFCTGPGRFFNIHYISKHNHDMVLESVISGSEIKKRPLIVLDNSLMRPRAKRNLRLYIKHKVPFIMKTYDSEHISSVAKAAVDFPCIIDDTFIPHQVALREGLKIISYKKIPEDISEFFGARFNFPGFTKEGMCHALDFIVKKIESGNKGVFSMKNALREMK